MIVKNWRFNQQRSSKSYSLTCACSLSASFLRVHATISQPGTETVKTESLKRTFFLGEKNTVFSESSISVTSLVTRKESHLQLRMDVKAARLWKKVDQTRYSDCRNMPFRSFKVLAQFKLPTFFGTAPTVQHYPFVSCRKVLYLRINRNGCW